MDNGCVELTVDRQANTASDLWQNEIYQGRNDCCVTDRIYFTQATLFLYVPEIQNDDYILKVGSEMIYLLITLIMVEH